MATKRTFKEDVSLPAGGAADRLPGPANPALAGLLREGLENGTLVRSKLGYAMLPKRGAVVTIEMINALRDEFE